jgi:2-dehydropantoate 2-reductase
LVSVDQRSGNSGVIAVLGAGALGRLWAALLSSDRCGFLPRLSGDFSQHELKPGGSFSHPEARPETRCEYALVRSASPDLGEARIDVDLPWLKSARNVELLLVTTKAGDTLSALNDWLPGIPETTPIVLFQNGLGSQQAVAERWPDRPVLAASTTEGANRPSPDVVVHAGAGDTWVGGLTESAVHHAADVVQQLSATSLRIHNEHNVLQRLWQKLVINAGINPFTALLDCPNGDILGSSLYQRSIDELCAEFSHLLQAETSGTATPKLLRERIEAVAKGTASNTSSMRADVAAGRKTEIDYINGYLVQCGKQHGIATPVNRMLTERVKALSTS